MQKKSMRIMIATLYYWLLKNINIFGWFYTEYANVGLGCEKTF